MEKIIVSDNYFQQDLIVYCGIPEDMEVIAEKQNLDFKMNSEWWCRPDEHTIRIKHKDLSVLIHELTHFVLYVWEKIGFEAKAYNEYYPYAMQFYFDEIRKQLFKKKPWINKTKK